MDITKEKYNPNPRERANPLGLLCFTYTIGIFRKGFRKILDVEDLYNPIKSDRSRLLGDRLESKWNKHLLKSPNGESSLLKVLIQTFWPSYLCLGFIAFLLNMICQILYPIMLGQLLNFFNPQTTINKTDALWYAGSVVALTGLQALLSNQYLMNSLHCGMKLRIAVCALIYRKDPIRTSSCAISEWLLIYSSIFLWNKTTTLNVEAIRLSKTAVDESASGKIVNLLSNDVSRFDSSSVFIHTLWTAPSQALIIMYLLYRESGYTGILGMATVFLFIPLQSYIGKLSGSYRRYTALRTDERVRLMDEVISGIQVIKMYAWEKPFSRLIKLARIAELKIITKSSNLRSLSMTLNLFNTRLALFATLLTMALTDQQITPARVFVCINYFNIVFANMSAMSGRGMSEVVETIVGIKRVQSFLQDEEYHTTVQTQNVGDKTFLRQTSVSLKNLTVKWSFKSNQEILKNINFNANKGKLVAIIGSVGCGKSSLLQTILGELEVVAGVIEVNGTVSYASQEPWVFAATIRQNITFGGDYDKKRYQEVVKACALEKDFEQFEQGDLSIVGDKGASLSGGQKARINLARALYRDADIYLLDDPLSAVDIHVSKHLYDKCINGFLADKTRILVTHQVYHLNNADHIVILDNGKIQAEGTYEELTYNDNLYAQLLTSEPHDYEEFKKIEMKSSDSLTATDENVKKSLHDDYIEISRANRKKSVTNNNKVEKLPEEIRLIDLQEQSSKGKIEGSLLWLYLRRGANICFVSFVLLCYILSQVTASSVDYFVSVWVNIEELRNVVSKNYSTYNDKTKAENDVKPIIDWSTQTCLYIYAGGLGLLWIVSFTRSMLFYKLAMWSSQKLHDLMFHSVVSAPMRFFDTNPNGRILNRFSKDIGAVDELLPKCFLDAGQVLLMMAGSLILIIIINPCMIIFVGVICALFLFLRVIFLRSSKNIKRLDGIMRSPVYTHLGATLQGLTTIRAFGAQAILNSEFDKHQDSHTSAWFMFISAFSAFGFYLDILSFFFVGIITFSFLTFGERLGLHGGEVGLALTQAASLANIVQYGIRQSAEVSNQLMSVERVLEYKSLPAEKEPEIPKIPPTTWPDKGEIIFENVGLRYIENKPASLRNLNITIKPNEKVGIVGRTGAGKTTLISALFRLATVEGSIKIDGIDTKDIPLKELRSKISIIPQDTVLFSGTLRYNLDPFDEYTDEQLYKAIEEVELKDPNNVITRLSYEVMGRGSNYSVGQRQLICLARAIVRNNKVLMLDEATANVDPQTDALIQKTIRKRLADCTVLTVAHRLNTIMDSDKVLVMDSGTMVEYDHPYNLLQNPNGVFNKMVAEAGKNLSEQLRKIAKDNYERSTLP